MIIIQENLHVKKVAVEIPRQDPYCCVSKHKAKNALRIKRLAQAVKRLIGLSQKTVSIFAIFLQDSCRKLLPSNNLSYQREWRAMLARQAIM